MKLEQLRILDAVVKTGSFAQAAQEILEISQPAVSMAIRKLEEDLGFVIFDRSTYRPQLTVAGKAFYHQAQQLLEKTDTLTSFAQTLAVGHEPEIRIAFDVNHLLPQIVTVLKSQTQAHPQTRFRFVSEILGGSLVQLLEHQVDLAILPWLDPYQELLPAIEVHPLAGISLSPLCAPDFPLYLLNRPLEPADLEGVTQIVTRSNERYLPTRGFGVFPQCQHWYVNDNATKQLLIQGGLGFGSLPHHMIRTELETGLLVPFENLLAFKWIEMEIRVVRRRDGLAGPVLNALWQAFKRLPYQKL